MSKFTGFEPEALELKDPGTVAALGKTIVFAPHPDDESLGCGGAIALLRKFDLPVSIVTMSDGTLSHPNSQKFPSEKLKNLREAEMLSALKILGVAEPDVSFLRFRDRFVPAEFSEGFNSAVEKIRDIFEIEKPQTAFVPWRRDPHPDHRATWQIVSAAIKLTAFEIRLIEYPIWLWELAEEEDLPSGDEFSLWRLDIQEVIEIKQAAIHAHISQTTDLIDDDPQGFRLSSEVLAYFAVPFEVYLEELK